MSAEAGVNNDESDIDKYLVSFSADVGCGIDDIAVALESQSDEVKETNWNILAKGKDELTSFVDIYTIVMGVIAYTLKTKNISNKPPKHAIMVLTNKILPKLPKYDDKPRLDEWEYMNNLHKILHEIAGELQSNTNSRNIGIDPHYAESSEFTQQQHPTNISSVIAETEIYIEGEPAMETTALKNPDTTSEQTTLGYEADSIKSNSTNITSHLSAAEIQEYYNMYMPTKCKKALCCRCVCFIIWIIICSALIDSARNIVQDTKEYEMVVTEETCEIERYEMDSTSSNQCIFDCGTNGCDTYEENYGDRVYKCDVDDDQDTCYGYAYTLVATADSKCGNTELFNDGEIDLLGCFDYKLESDIGTKLDCYVLDCEDQEFMLEDPLFLSQVGQMVVWFFVIVMLIGVSVCAFAPYCCSCLPCCSHE